MKSWCDYTFFDTLENLRRVGILTVGAGENLKKALEPVVVEIKGVRFGFVSLGDSKLSPVVFAGEDHPGIAHLNEENMRVAIQAARRVSDVVIVLPHWGSEDIILPNGIQRNQAQYIVDAGSDLVVGNHTHVVQAYQQIDGIQVFYGLGNFVFDQGLRDHRQGVILLIQFKGVDYIGYEMIPTHVDQDGRVHIADPEEAAEILERVRQASQVLN
jgi:poly-gamma-glutamate synthesis protein (capsule biosynthesis protein)